MGAFGELLMKSSLTAFQKRFAEYRVVFDANFLSPSLAEALRRATTACADNSKTETGIIDFVCGLFLHYRDEVAHHFNGDFRALVSRNFPVHRFGDEGLIPKAMLNQMSSGGNEAEASFGYSLKFNDELLRLLWSAVKLSNAVGKDASLFEVVQALALENEWTDALLRCGLTLSRVVADFDREVETVIFFAPLHTGPGWPTKMEFELDDTVLPPFTLEISTPSSRFRPVHSAKVNLNGDEVANINWPDKATSRTSVQLSAVNKIGFELDGPKFGSVDVTVRGTSVDEGKSKK